MKSSLAGVAAVAAVLSAPVAFAEEAACYVDTSAFDYLNPGYCWGMGPWSGTAVFGVLGLDQTSGRYNVIWLDGTCDSTYYTVQEGSICIRDISWGQTTQRVQVVDTWTGIVSPILYATAEYETNG